MSNINIDNAIWETARRAALKVDFISTAEELRLYTDALCAAMKWGWGKALEDKSREISRKKALNSKITF